MAEKQKEVIITRKIEVHLHHDPVADPDKVEYNRQWEVWHTINNNLYKAANRIVSHKFFNDEYEHRLQLHSPEFQEINRKLARAKKEQLSAEEIAALRSRLKELYAQFADEKRTFLRGGVAVGPNPEQNSTDKVVRDEFSDVVPTEILTCLNQSVSSTYSEYKKQIARGERAIPNYKKGMPVPIRMKANGQLKLRRRPDNSIYVLTPRGLEWDLSFGRDRSNNREIVERVLSGQYDVGGSSIQEKGRKIFLLLVVKLPASQNELNPERVVGVDLGLNIPLYAALNDNEYGGLSIGSRDKFMKERERMSARRRELQRSLRISTQGGHGRSHKLKALDQFEEKERNWVHTQNHIFSRQVVEYAKSNGAGVIQMESLKGFGKDKEEHIEQGFKYVVRYWSYFELQTLIQQKAEREGIEVRKVNPYHTSQTCSFCGHYEKGQRVSQSTFICKNPACAHGKGKQLKDGAFAGINADWNAARNIALSTEWVKE